MKVLKTVSECQTEEPKCHSLSCLDLRTGRKDRTSLHSLVCAVPQACSGLVSTPPSHLATTATLFLAQLAPSPIWFKRSLPQSPLHM